MKITVEQFDGSIWESYSTLQFQLYRKPHDFEMFDYDDEQHGGWIYGGDSYRLGQVRNTVINNPDANPHELPMPEVYKVKYPDHQTPLSCGWLHLWRDINPDLTTQAWSTLVGDGLAWCNNTGSPPRSNCVTGYQGDGKTPAFHAPIVNGGGILKGEEVIDPYTGMKFLSIETMLSSGAIPSAQYVLERPWLWDWGVQISKTAQITYIRRMGKNGETIPVRIPRITKYPIKLPLDYLDKLPIGFIPPSPMWLP